MSLRIKLLDDKLKMCKFYSVFQGIRIRNKHRIETEVVKFLMQKENYSGRNENWKSIIYVVQLVMT